MTIQAWAWTADGAALAVVVLAGVMDWRRDQRPDLDRPGWVPWRGIQAAGFFALLLLTIMAVNAA
jgi:hypothetical protein